MSQTAFNNNVTVNASLTVAPTNTFANGLVVRMPADTLGQGINVINSYSNLLTLDKQGFLTVPAANLGDHVIVKTVWIGDKSASISGWPGMITATNITGPNSYVPIVAKEFWSGTSQGLTTNINVISDSGATNQLQFTGGILTGIIRQ